MTIKEVKKLLGEPDKIIKNDKKVLEALDWDNENSVDMWSPDFSQAFFGSVEEIIKYDDLVDEQVEEVICYEYEYYYSTGGEDIWHLYFLEDKLKYTYRP